MSHTGHSQPNIINVELNKRAASKTMTTAVARSRRMLVALTVEAHRGPADTWTAARDRVAVKAGIERTYAARIWNRWEEMRDVSGETLTRLSEAYVALCRRSEKTVAAQDALLKDLDLEKAHEVTLAAIIERHQHRMATAGASKASQAPTASP